MTRPCLLTMKTWLLAASLLLAHGQGFAGGDKAGASARPFLGVHVVRVPDEVRAQTELAEGEGLMVDFVRSESAAREAGIEVYDILTHLEDQKLLSSEQFSNLIKAAAINQEVTISLLRKGRPLTVTATLTPAPEGVESGRPEAVSSDLEKLLPDLIKALKKQQGGTSEPGSAPANSTTMTMADNDGSVEILTQNGVPSAVVKDAEGKVLFSGTIQTEEQRQALAPEVRVRIERLEQSAKAVSGPR